jgi:hypothetical protein
MKATPVAATFAAAACITVAALLAGCGSASPSARSTVTVTVTAPTSAPPGTGGATPTAAPAGGAGCSTRALKGSLGPGSGAAGSSYFPIVFTNTSGSACTLYGYPGVSFVTAAGSQVGMAAIEDPTFPRQLVTLPPGGTAHAEMRIVVAQNYPASTCSPIPVSVLKVYPPGQTSALVIPVTSTGCGNATLPILAVQTVQSGSG